MAMRHPLPGFTLAFRICDAVPVCCGVRSISFFSGRLDQAAQLASELDFFMVERIEPKIRALSDGDLHLYVVTCVTTHCQRLTITSSVGVRSGFGWLYMIAVGPVDRLTVSTMMRLNLQGSCAGLGGCRGQGRAGAIPSGRFWGLLRTIDCHRQTAVCRTRPLLWTVPGTVRIRGGERDFRLLSSFFTGEPIRPELSHHQM